MDEGNIFDDIKDVKNDELSDRKNSSDDTITMTRQDLKEIIDNVKTRYVAEIDAIMLE